MRNAAPWTGGQRCYRLLHLQNQGRNGESMGLKHSMIARCAHLSWDCRHRSSIVSKWGRSEADSIWRTRRDLKLKTRDDHCSELFSTYALGALQKRAGTCTPAYHLIRDRLSRRLSRFLESPDSIQKTQFLHQGFRTRPIPVGAMDVYPERNQGR
jgi:hypothetical protein